MKRWPHLRQMRGKWLSLAVGSVTLIFGYLLATINIPLKISLDKSSQEPTKALQANFCTELVEPSVALSQEQLSKLTEVPAYSKRQQVEQILKQPYCRLSSLNIRAGTLTEREVYPLASNPSTSLIVLYEDENYLGYGFKQL